MNIEEEIKGIRFKLRSCPSFHSHHDDKPLEDEIMFQRMELLFEDLKKVKAEIDKHLLDSLSIELSENTGTKKKLEGIKQEYLRVLSDVEEGKNEVKKLKNSIDSLEKKSNKHKSIRRKNRKNKSAFVYHVRSCRNMANRGIYAYGGVYLKSKKRCDLSAEPSLNRLPICCSPSRVKKNEAKSASKDYIFNKNTQNDRSHSNDKETRSRDDTSLEKANSDQKDIKAYKVKQKYDEVKIKRKACSEKPNAKKGWVNYKRGYSEKQEDVGLNEGLKYFKSNKSEKKAGNKSPDRCYIENKNSIAKEKDNTNVRKGKKLGEKSPDIKQNVEKQNFMIVLSKSDNNELPYSESEGDKILNSSNKFEGIEKQVRENKYEYDANDSSYNFPQFDIEKEKSPIILKDSKDKRKSSIKKNVEEKIPDQSKESLNSMVDKSDSSEFPYSDNEDDKIATNKFRKKEKQAIEEERKRGYTEKGGYKTYEYGENELEKTFGIENNEKTGQNAYVRHGYKNEQGKFNIKSPLKVIKNPKEYTKNVQKGSKSPDIEQNLENYVLLKDPRDEKKHSGNIEELIDRNKINLNTLEELKGNDSEYQLINETNKILDSTDKFLNDEKPTRKSSYKMFEYDKNEPGYKFQFKTEKHDKSPIQVLKNLKGKTTKKEKKVGSKSPDIEQDLENKYVLLKDPKYKKKNSGNKIEEFIEKNKMNRNIMIGELKKNDSDYQLTEEDKILDSTDKFTIQEKPTTRKGSYKKLEYDENDYKFQQFVIEKPETMLVRKSSPPKTDSTTTQNINLSSENQELRTQISQLKDDLFKLYNNYRTEVGVEKSNILNKNNLSKDSLNVISRQGSHMSNSSLKKRTSEIDPIIVLGKINGLDKNYGNSENIETEPKNVLDELNNKLSVKEKLIIKLDEASKVLEKACDQETNRLKDLKNQEVDTSHKLLRKSYEFDELLAENIKTRKILDEKHDNIQTLEDGNKKLNRDKVTLTYDKQKLMKQTGELANKIKLLNEQSQKWLMSENRLKNLIDREKKSHEATKKDLDDAKSRLFAHLKEINAFNTDKEVAVVKAAQLETSITEMKKKLDDKEKYLKHLESRTKGLEEELKTTNQSYEIMIADRISQLKQPDTKLEEIIQPEIEMEKLLELFNQLKSTNSTLKEEFIKVGQENLNVQYEKLNLTKKHEDLENQVKKYKTELEKIKVSRRAKKLQIKELDCQIKSIASIKETTDLKIKDLEQTIIQSNQILQSLENKFNYAEQENASIAKTVENTNQQICYLKKANLEFKTKLNEISNINVIPSSSSCGNLNTVPVYQNHCYPEEPIRITKSEHLVKAYNDGYDQSEDVSCRSDFLGQFQVSSVQVTSQNESNDPQVLQSNNCECLQKS